MIWIILGVGLVAAIVEAWNDRRGETKKDKIRDAIYLSAFVLLVSLIACYLKGLNPLKTISLILGVRVLVFDYLVSYLLIKNDVIVGNWWDYTGKTSKFDWVVSKIDWRLRIVIRVILFGAALWWFIL